MTIKTKASVQADFKGGQKPTQPNFEDLIDSSYTGEIGEALVSAAAVSAGLINIIDVSSMSLTPPGSAGLAVLSASTPASARAAISVQEDVITTQGDLAVGDSNGSAARLSIGASGQRIQTSGSSIEYFTPIPTVSAATTAETVDGSAADKFVTPAGFRQHRAAAKLWVANSQTTVNAGYNVDSITDVGVGEMAVNFNPTAATFVSGHYAAHGAFREVLTSIPNTIYVTAQSTLSCRLVVSSLAAVASDPAGWYLIAYGSVA